MMRTIIVSGLLLALAAGGIMAEDKQAPQPPGGAPEYQAPSRPTDGVNMALTVEKLEKGFDPDRPLLIWAIGSSFTNGLGDGTALTELVRARFPNMPKVVYKKMAGNSTSYHYTLGWARHLVIPDQPDVVLLYNFGKAEDLEKLIVELRRHTTADIIVGTLHWCIPHKPLWGKPDAPNSHQDPPAMRALCAKYGAEFVENRAEMTEYMSANKLSIESLLRDSVHETPCAASMTVRNIARHFNRPEHFGYDPRSRERRVEPEASDAVRTEGDWARDESGFLVAGRNGGSVSMEFKGNRIDLIGQRAPDGGSAEVLIDGKPADQAPVFYAGYIQPNPKNAPAPPNPPRDRAPHLLMLGDNIIPQQWTVTLTSDKGDYALVGSVTGSDGDGNAKVRKPSKSGQIIIEPDYWRGAETNRAGDTFAFEVRRCATGRVDFKGERSRFRLTLIWNLPNGPHTLRLVAKGDGPVALDAFDVFQPPLE